MLEGQMFPAGFRYHIYLLFFYISTKKQYKEWCKEYRNIEVCVKIFDFLNFYSLFHINCSRNVLHLETKLSCT